MIGKHEDLAGTSANGAATFAMDNDLGDLFAEGEAVRERRPAKMVTALRIDLGIQAELEAAAAARGIGSSTLMRSDHRRMGVGQSGRASPGSARRACAPPGRSTSSGHVPGAARRIAA